MKFAHFADCHIGSWREEKLKQLSNSAFVLAIDTCINEKVDFVVIAGDLFNTALPSIDAITLVAKSFRKLQQANIPTYLVPGSHDFSPSGKTMLSVLEQAGLCKNVCKGEVIDGILHLKFTQDPSGVKLTGMLGKRGTLEKQFYEHINREDLEREEGEKIFVFHTAIQELKTKEHVESAPLSLLPKGFDYYAGGHVHVVSNTKVEGYSHIVYPGPVFPNSFSELEELKKGGMVIFDGEVKNIPLVTKEVESIVISCDDKAIEDIEEELLEHATKDVQDKLVLIRLKGLLKSGKVSDIKFKEIMQQFLDNGAYFVMKSTSLVKTTSFEEIAVKHSSVEELEHSLIKEHAGQHEGLGVGVELEIDILKSLMKHLHEEKHEGEVNRDFEERIKQRASRVLEELD